MTTNGQKKTHVKEPQPFFTGKAGASALFLALLLGTVFLFSTLHDGGLNATSAGEIELLIITIGFFTVGPLIVTRSLRLSLTQSGWIGLVLLAAFILWSGLGLLWSVDTGATWSTLNMQLSCLLVLFVVLSLATSHPNGASWVRGGLLLAITVVAGYGFATKAIPGVDIKGIVNFNHGPGLSISATVGSAQTLGALCVLGLPLALAFMTSSGTVARPFGLFTSVLLITCTGLTCSRGAIAGIIAMIFATAFIGKRWQHIWPFLGTLLLAAPSLAYAFHEPDIWKQTATLGQRKDAGLVLLAIFLGSILFGIALQFVLKKKSRSKQKQRSQTLSPARGVTAFFLVALATGAAILTFSGKGFEASLDDGWQMFLHQNPPTAQADRLVSVKNGDRYQLWQESVGMLSDRVVGGWGSGAFATARSPYATAATTDIQHSQTGLLAIAAETGTIGFLLWLGAFAAFLIGAIKRVRQHQKLNDEKQLAQSFTVALTLIGFFVMQVTFSHWDTPAITLPIFALIGLTVYQPVFTRDPRSTRAFIDSRLAWTLVALIALSSLAVSSGAPYLAARETKRAQKLIKSKEVTEQNLAASAADAATAARLNPLSAEPLLVAAEVAQKRNRLLDARDYLLAATRRQPRSPVVWNRLAELELTLADFQGAQAAAQRAIRYTPASKRTQDFLTRAQQGLLPPANSPTAIGTPLRLASDVTTSSDPFGVAQPNTGTQQNPDPLANADTLSEDQKKFFAEQQRKLLEQQNPGANGQK